MPSPTQNPSPEAQELVLELSHDLMSPYCPGRTIATCPSPQARKLENEMLVKAEAGMDREQIESELVARFPDIQGYVGRPELLWGSALLAVVAIVSIAWAARRWIRQGQAKMENQGIGDPLGPASAREASLSEIDALEDALDEVDDF